MAHEITDGAYTGWWACDTCEGTYETEQEAEECEQYDAEEEA